MFCLFYLNYKLSQTWQHLSSLSIEHAFPLPLLSLSVDHHSQGFDTNNSLSISHCFSEFYKDSSCTKPIFLKFTLLNLPSLLTNSFDIFIEHQKPHLNIIIIFHLIHKSGLKGSPFLTFFSTTNIKAPRETSHIPQSAQQIYMNWNIFPQLATFYLLEEKPIFFLKHIPQA